MNTTQTKIESLTDRAAGSATVADKTYLIDGALPGETVEFAHKAKGRRGRRGQLLRVITPSPDRIQPRCEYFGTCGGCALQHLAMPAQLQHKQKILLENLGRIANLTPRNLLPPLTANEWNYRRRARPGIRDVAKKGGILVGFRERNSSYITSLQHCAILDARLSALLPGLHALVSSLSCRAAAPQVEMAAGDDAVALVLRHLQALTEADIAAITAFAVQNQVRFYTQAGGLDSVRPLSPEAPPPLSYALADEGITLQFSPTDFVQINAAVNAKMVARAMQLLAPATGEKVLDLFCGLGNFTLPIARRGAEVLGVEGEAGLVARARENATLNGIANARFCRADLHDLPADLTEMLPADFCRADKMLLDPPRSGAVEVVKRLAGEFRPRVLVYVSCNPATFARDAGVLANVHGYELTDAGVVDMFPHTGQVEVVGRFALK